MSNTCIKKSYESLLGEVEKTYPELTEDEVRLVAGRNMARALAKAGTTNKVEAEIMDYIIAKSYKGQMILVPNGSSKAQIFETPINVVKNGTSITVHMLSGKNYTFKNGSKHSTITKNKNIMTSEIMDSIEDNAAAEIYNSDNTTSNDDHWIYDEKLGEMREKTFNEKVANHQQIHEKDLVNNPENVKKMIDTLVEMEKDEVSQEEIEFLKEVADIIADPIARYGRELNVYVDTKARDNGGFIRFDGEKKGIYLSVSGRTSPIGNEMSVAQRYVHELVHGVTHFAYNYGGARLTGTISRLKKLHNDVMKVVTWEDFMPDVSIDYEAEKARAKERWDYINSSKNSMEEFIAYAMTHKKLRDKLKTISVGRQNKSTKGMTAWETLKEYVSRMISWAFEKTRNESKDMKADQLIMKLTKDLMEANDLAVKQYNNKALNSVAESIELAEDWWADSSDKVINWVSEHTPIDRSTIPAKDEKFKGAIWLLKNSWKLWSDKEFRPYFSTILSSMFMPQEGTLQTLMRHMTDTDAFQDKLEELGLMRNHVDQIRRKIKQGTKGMLNKLWGRKLTKGEKKSITFGVLKTDLGALVDNYTQEEVQELLTNPDKLKEAAKAEEAKLTDSNPRIKRYKVEMAKGLAKLMVTGKGSRIQQMNAYTINNMIGTKYETKHPIPSSNSEKVIDRLTTLYALQMTAAVAPDVSKTVSKLAEENIEAVLAYSRLQQEYNAKQYKNPIQVLKGWVKEEYDSDITSKIAPVSQEDEMAEKGFKLVEVIKGSHKSILGGEVALYINKDKMITSYNVSAMGLTDTNKHQGTTLMDNSIHTNVGTAYRRNQDQIRLLERKNGKMIEDIMNGVENIPHSVENLLAMKDDTGKTVGFVYGLTSDQKLNVLKMETDPGEVIGSMMASLHDQEETDKLNKMLVTALKKDMELNFDLEEFDGEEDINGAVGENGAMYVKITKESDHPTVQKIYQVMPTKMKKEINSMKHGLWVKREALHDAFGFRSGSVVDLKMLKMMPAIVKKAVRMAEKMWEQIIKVAKVDIVMRVPGVLIGNIVSNTMYLVQMGFNPKDVIAMQANGLNELHRYVDTSNKIAQLEAKEIGAKLTANEKKELDRLKSTLEDGSIGDLVDAGLYQAIVEDVGLDDIKSSSKIHTWANDKLDTMGAPGWVKSGANWMYVSEKTSLFQFMQRATQYSDFVSRYAMYHMGQEKAMRKFEKKNKRKMTANEMAVMKKSLIKEITQSFINYNKPDSVFLQWMNDVGLIMFTKWALRIQKVWKDGVAKHPIRFMMAAAGQDLAGINLDDISDASILERGIDGLIHSPDAGDLVWRAFTPVVFRLDENL